MEIKPIKMTKSLKKIEADIASIQGSIGGSLADIINFAQKIIRDEGFLDAKSGHEQKGKFTEYGPAPGANRRRLDKRPRKTARRVKNPKPRPFVFHDKKIVNRDDKLKSIFHRLNFGEVAGKGGKIFRARTHALDVEILSTGKQTKAVYAFNGKYQKWFGLLDLGVKTTIIKDDKPKNTRTGQRRIVPAGLGKAMRRFDKLARYNLQETLKKRSAQSDL